MIRYEINGIDVWDWDEDDMINGKMNKVTAYGAILIFAEWMQNHCENISDPIAWDGLGTIVVDVMENTSDIRGNHMDFHRNYEFTEDGFEFNGLYYHENGLTYAEVYDKQKNEFIGYVELNS